jgi:hypothetical protein
MSETKKFRPVRATREYGKATLTIDGPHWTGSPTRRILQVPATDIRNPVRKVSGRD